MAFKLIIGLGNPGTEYENTYHNIGGRFIDYLGSGILFKRQKSFQFSRKGDLILAKPLIFMNESGEAARDALRRFKLRPSQMLIVHDDNDIPLGELRLAFGRGSAGHKGAESVIKELGNKEFWRARIGIKKNAIKKAGDIVLKKITKSDWEKLIRVFRSLEIQIFNEEGDAERNSVRQSADAR